MNDLCSGCGSKLGFKKYQFRRQWRIPGVYCKGCMMKIGAQFEKSAGGVVTLPKQQCALCKNDFYFLQNRKIEAGRKSGSASEQYCNMCHDVVTNGEPLVQAGKESARAGGNKHAQMPQSSMIAGATGIVLMLGGLVFTFMTTSAGGGSLINILFGAGTTVMGLVLFRKTMQSRRIIYGK